VAQIVWRAEDRPGATAERAGAGECSPQAVMEQDCSAKGQTDSSICVQFALFPYSFYNEAELSPIDFVTREIRTPGHASFYFLGFPYLDLDGNVLPDLATRKAVSLLGYLTMRPGQSHSRESLVTR
jgi:hypothetical protein